jgi:hypothetical protein
MATKRVDLLSSSIDRLASAAGIAPEMCVIEVPAWLNEQEVVDRHMKLYPRDKRAQTTVIVRRFSEIDPDEYRDEEVPVPNCGWQVRPQGLRSGSQAASQDCRRGGCDLDGPIVRLFGSTSVFPFALLLQFWQ